MKPTYEHAFKKYVSTLINIAEEVKDTMFYAMSQAVQNAFEPLAGQRAEMLTMLL